MIVNNINAHKLTYHHISKTLSIKVMQQGPHIGIGNVQDQNTLLEQVT